MIDRTTRLTVALEAQQWDLVLNTLAEGPFRVVAPLVQEIQRQCMQQSETAAPTASAMRGNGEIREESHG